MSDTDGIVQEFLLESFEGLEQVDRDLVALEERPGDRDLLDRVFRVVHTIKGTCSFLGYPVLERLSHAGEHLLSRLRDGSLTLSPAVATSLLELVDLLRHMLATIRATGSEGEVDAAPLLARLEVLAKDGAAGTEPAATEDAAPAWTLAAGAATASDSAVRIDVRVLDRLMDLVGELVLTRNQLLRLTDTGASDGLGTPLQHLNLVTSELQEGIMKTRMQPVGRIWGKFPRLVRDLAAACGKSVRLEMEGQETELDRSLIEAIRDPLTHLVRNAIDHGIETPQARRSAGKPEHGMLRLMAYHEGGQVNIEIADDGAGIDAEQVRRTAVERGMVGEEQAARLSRQEALNLIFLPGFSTAREVTKVSGRGVGMDVVKTNLERVNGLIDVSSEPGRGTTIKLKIPLTLAIIPALIVVTGGQRFAVPQASILELVRLGRDEQAPIEEVHGAPVYRLRGRLLPLVDLGRELQTAPVLDREGAVTLAVLQADERQFGLVVDAVEDSQEIVVKPLGRLLERIPVYAGATIMGDGRVALILDVLGLAQRAHVVSEVRERSLLEAQPDAAVREQERERLLLFRSPDDGRMAIPLSEVMRLEQLPAGSVEWVGGAGVVQYRGDILPLVQVFAHLPERRQEPRAAEPNAEIVDVVVYRHLGRDVGLVVGTILDIVEEVIEVRRPSSRQGVRECAVIRGRVSELLDVDWVIRTAAPPFHQRPVEE